MRIELPDDQARRFRARLRRSRYETTHAEDKACRDELVLDEEIVGAVLRQHERPPVL